MSKYERILVAIDFTETSLGALRSAVQLANTFNARLQVMHVRPATLPQGAIPVSPTPPVLPPPTPKRGMEARLARLVEPFRARVSISTRIEVGDPATRMIEASQDVDLIVLGAHQRSAVRDLLHGSVERKVSKRAKCPVLLVPETDAVEAKVES